jgi:FeS assembly SUF system protein
MNDERQMTDEAYEGLKRRRLDVLNAGSPEKTDPFALEDEAFAPSEKREAPAILKDRVIQALRTVYDPEIPLNIYDLGLVYGVDVGEDGAVHVRMTLTAPGCPVAGSLVQEVHDRVRATAGVRRAKTELVWDPPWTQERLSLEARLELGLL